MMAKMIFAALVFQLTTIAVTGAATGTKDMVFQQTVDLSNVAPTYADYCNITFYNQVKIALATASSTICTNCTLTSAQIAYLKVGQCGASVSTRRLDAATAVGITSRITMPAADADTMKKNCNTAMQTKFRTWFKATLDAQTGKPLGSDTVGCPQVAGWMRNIGLGAAGAAAGAVMLGVGIGCGLNGCLSDASTPAPKPVTTVAPVPVLPTQPPLAALTPAEKEDDGVPSWLGPALLLGLCLLCAIGAAVFLLRRNKKKKSVKRGVKSEPKVEDQQPLSPVMVPVRTYAAPATYQPTNQQTYQPVQQVTYAAPQTYAAPAAYQQTYQPLAARMF